MFGRGVLLSSELLESNPLMQAKAALATNKQGYELRDATHFVPRVFFFRLLSPCIYKLFSYAHDTVEPGW